jgi:hypothetical protein
MSTVVFFQRLNYPRTVIEKQFECLVYMMAKYCIAVDPLLFL